MIHVNFRCPSFSVIMKLFAIFWVVNLRRLATLNWCWWLEHMFHFFKCRWQHIVTKGRFWELCVVRKWAISKSCTNGLDYFFCHIRLPQNVEYLTCIRFDPAYCIMLPFWMKDVRCSVSRCEQTLGIIFRSRGQPRCLLLALFIFRIQTQKDKKHLLYGFPVRV